MANETKQIAKPFTVNYMYFTESGQQRNASILVLAKDIIEARTKAHGNLIANYTYFKVTKIKQFENDHPQQNI